MPASQLHSRLLVLLFTDLLDSSRLKVELGDAAYVEQIARPHNAIFRELLARFPGAEENNYTGDGFLATFLSVNDAVNFALLLHHALRTREWQGVIPSTRVGIHIGDTVEFEASNDDARLLASHAADMCARVMGLGHGGQTLLTRAAFDSARQYVRKHPDTGSEQLPEIRWLAHGRYRFKGKDEPMEVFEVGAVGSAPLQAPASSEKARRALSPEEEQTLGWRPGARLTIPGRPGWILQQKVGEGGFGEVWLAQQERLKEQRVFKFCFDADRLRSFKRELTLFRLIQEGLGDRDDITRLLDVRIDRPPFYLESEYVRLGNLRHWSESQGGIGCVSVDTRLKLLADVARAVAAAHSLGIIHKDIKPSNILIDERADGSPQPKLADFGIGVVTDRALLAQHQVTETGFTESLVLGNNSSRTGTRLYAPPESQVGKPASTAGDVYSLGVMLYQLLTGELSRPLGVGWESDIDDELLREDVTACTHADPARRLANAAELAERLETLPARREASAARTRAEAERLAMQTRVAEQKQRLRTLKIGMSVALLFAFVAAGAAVWVNHARLKLHQANQQRVLAEVDALLHAVPAAVPSILEELATGGQPVVDRLLELRRDDSLTPPMRRRIEMALLPTDSNVRTSLVESLLGAEPDECLLLCRVLNRSGNELAPALWELVGERNETTDRRFRAAVALAHFDPDNKRWADICDDTAQGLVSTNQLHLSVWKDALRPVAKRLTSSLNRLFRDPDPQRRQLTAFVLADYSRDSAESLADLIIDADERQFDVVFSVLARHGDAATVPLRRELAKPVTLDSPDLSKELQAKRQSNAAVALARLGDSELIWGLLAHDVDPRRRSFLIHRLAALGANPEIVVSRLVDRVPTTPAVAAESGHVSAVRTDGRAFRDLVLFDPETSIRRALLLALGEFDASAMTPAARDRLAPRILELFENDPDAGVHSAAEWLLYRWGYKNRVDDSKSRLVENARSVAATFQADTRRRNWFVNGQGQTYVVVGGPVDFQMGSPADEKGRDHDQNIERQHTMRVDRSFAMAATEVTVEQFRRFRNNHRYNSQYAPTEDCPVNSVSWYDAAAYCNWLGEQDGLPPDQLCYLPNKQGEMASGMSLAHDYLQRTGYRLPREAEWELACRAGTVTSRYCGQSEELLDQYAWFIPGPMERWMIPVGRLKPNDLGLFDILGNAWERCEGPFEEYGANANDDRVGSVIDDDETHAMRGGSIFHASRVRSADRQLDGPTMGHNYVSFRPVRTLSAMTP